MPDPMGPEMPSRKLSIMGTGLGVIETWAQTLVSSLANSEPRFPHLQSREIRSHPAEGRCSAAGGVCEELALAHSRAQ